MTDLICVTVFMNVHSGRDPTDIKEKVNKEKLYDLDSSAQ